MLRKEKSGENSASIPQQIVSGRRAAIGALAIGAFATGAMAIGAVAIGSLAIKRGKIDCLEINELTVRVAELIVERQPTI